MTNSIDYASMAAEIVKTMVANGQVKDPSTIPNLIAQIGMNLRMVGSGEPIPATAPVAPTVVASAPTPSAPSAPERTKRQSGSAAKARAQREADAAAQREADAAAQREVEAAAQRKADATQRKAAAAAQRDAEAAAQREAEAAVQREAAAATSKVEDPRKIPVSITGQAPAVAIRESVTKDSIICLEDGRKMKMLKRHLRAAFDMSPEEYRYKWGLPENYPMVAPNYAKMKSKYARHVGLGTHRMREEVAAKQKEMEQA